MRMRPGRRQSAGLLLKTRSRYLVASRFASRYQCGRGGRHDTTRSTTVLQLLFLILYTVGVRWYTGCPVICYYLTKIECKQYGFTLLLVPFRNFNSSSIIITSVSLWVPTINLIRISADALVNQAVIWLQNFIGVYNLVGLVTKINLLYCTF